MKLCEKCGRVVENEAQNYCDDCIDETTSILKKNVSNGKKSVEYRWLIVLLKTLAWIELVAGILLAIIAIAFELELLGSIVSDVIVSLLLGTIGFSILSAFSLFVNVANEYLAKRL